MDASPPAWLRVMTHCRLGASARPRDMMRSLTVPGTGPNVPTPSRWIPVPDVPVYPVLSIASLRAGGAEHFPNVMDAGPAVYFRMARYAILQALRLMGVKAEERVLVPAYHCSSMIAPIAHLMATPVFYRVHDDLSVDLADLASKIDSRTRAVIAPHYFGFHQKVADLRDLCDRHELYLLEDCAHAFFGEMDGCPIGSYGDFTVASLWKFFPVPEGGCLISTAHNLERLSPKRPGLVADLSAAYKSLGQAIRYGRMTSLRPVLSGLELAGAARRALRGGVGASMPEGTAAPPQDATSQAPIDSAFDSKAVDMTLGRFCRTLFTTTARLGCTIAERRRHNYLLLQQRFESIPGCRPVIKRLPDGVVPFMFPLWIDKLPRVFPSLEDAAVPMQRFGQFLWPGVDAGVCPASSELSHFSLQLPCHQDLDDGDIENIGERFEHILTVANS